MQSCYLHQTVQEIKNTPGRGCFQSTVKEVRKAVMVLDMDSGHCLIEVH